MQLVPNGCARAQVQACSRRRKSKLACRYLGLLAAWVPAAMLLDNELPVLRPRSKPKPLGLAAAHVPNSRGPRAGVFLVWVFQPAVRHALWRLRLRAWAYGLLPDGVLGFSEPVTDTCGPWN